MAAEPVELAKLKLDRELGSAFDFSQGQLFFGWKDDSEVEFFEPEEFSAKELQAMLDSDGQARKLEQALTLPVRSAPWSVRPFGAREPGASDAVSEWVSDTLARPAALGGMSTPIETVIAQMTSAFVHRLAFFEKVFTTRESRIVYDKVAFRPHGACTLLRDAKTGAFRGFKQELADKKDPVKIPPPYALVYVHGRHRNPLSGISDFAVAAKAYETKKKLEWLWFTFCENSALPRVVVAAKDEGSAKRAAKAIASLRNSGVVGVPEQWVSQLRTLDVAGQGAGAFEHALRWLDTQMASSVLAGFTDLAGRAVEGTGSYALSRDASRFFLLSLQAYAREMSETLTNWLVADLVRYNFGRGVAPPQFSIGPVRDEDASASFDMLSQLASAPTLRVPDEFVDELTLRVAQALDLDVDKVRAAQHSLAERSTLQLPGPLAGVSAAADALAGQAERAR